MLSAVPIFVLWSQNKGQHKKIAPGHKTLNMVTIICLWVVTFVLSERLPSFCPVHLMDLKNTTVGSCAVLTTSD